MAEAADLLRQCGELDRDRVIGRRQIGDDLVEDRLEFADQPAFGAPFLAAGEDVEPGAAQPAQLGQQPENGQHPRTEFALAQMPGLRIALAHDRRGEVEAQLGRGPRSGRRRA